MATIGTVEGILRLRNEFSSQLDKATRDLDQTTVKMERAGKGADMLGAALDDAGVSLDEVDDQSRRAGEGLSRLGDSASSSGDDMLGARDKATKLAGSLVLVGTVLVQVRSEMGEIIEEISELSPAVGTFGESIGGLGADIKGLVLTGPLAGFRIWLREVNEELDRLNNLKKIEKIGGQIGTLDRIALRVAGALGLLRKEIIEIAELPGRLDLSALSRQERTIAGLATAEDKLQNAIDRVIASQEDQIDSSRKAGGERERLAKTTRDEAVKAEEAFRDAIQGLSDDLPEMFERVEDRLDDVARATRIYEDELQILGAALRAEIIDQERFNELVDLARERLDDATAAAEGFSEEVENIPEISAGAFDDLPVGVAVAAEELGTLFEEVMNDVGRALADAIISGDVQDAVEGLSRSLEAAFADALARAIGGAASGQGFGGFADALTLGITATLFAAFTKTGPFREVEVTVRSIAAQLDALGLVLLELGEESDAASQSLSALSAAEAEIFARLQASIGEVLTQLGVEIPAAFERFTFSIKEVLEDGVSQGFEVDIDLGPMGEEGAGRTRLAGEIERTFETLEEALGFATREFLRELIDQGVAIDEAVRQLVQGEDVPLSVFQEAAARVQSLADRARMSLDGVTAFEIALEKLPAQMQQLAGELRTLGLSADQVTRLVGGQLVASFQAMRQQITGEELSVEERRRIAEANADLFNAELELQILRLEADKAALLAEAGIVQEEVKLHGNVIDARARFVNAEASVFDAELGVMAGFVTGAGAVLNEGVKLISDTSAVFGDVLASLPEEIRKQVEAIQKVIDALRKIGTISPGDINIPSVGGGVGGVGGGGARPSGPTLQDSIDSLVDAVLRDIESQQQLITALEDSLMGLERFIGDLRVGDPSPLTAGQQVALLRDRLADVAGRALEGDAEAIQEFQRIAQQLRTIGAQAFGTAGSGFEALLREIEHLGGDILTEGNVLLENELEALQDIRNEFADLLLLTRDLHDLTAEQITAIREGTSAELGGVANIIQQLSQGQSGTRADLRELREVIVALGRILADAA